MIKLLIAITLVTLNLYTSGCSKSKVSEDGDTQSTDGGSLELGEESVKTEEGLKTDEAQAGFVDTQLPEDPLGKPQDTTTPQGGTSEELSLGTTEPTGIESLPPLDLENPQSDTVSNSKDVEKTKTNSIPYGKN